MQWLILHSSDILTLFSVKIGCIPVSLHTSDNVFTLASKSYPCLPLSSILANAPFQYFTMTLAWCVACNKAAYAGNTILELNILWHCFSWQVGMYFSRLACSDEQYYREAACHFEYYDGQSVTTSVKQDLICPPLPPWQFKRDQQELPAFHLFIIDYKSHRDEGRTLPLSTFTGCINNSGVPNGGGGRNK